MSLEVFSPQEIAKILKISYEKALDFVKYSGIPYVKIGRVYRVTKDNFEAFMNSSETRIIDISESVDAGNASIYYKSNRIQRRTK